VIDIGGGFPAATLDAAPFDDRYGAMITASLDRHLAANPPEVMAEPGRALVADAGVLETEVVLVAEREGVRWVYLDVGLFRRPGRGLRGSIRYRLEVRRDGTPLTGEVGETVLAGPTCDSIDVLFRKNRYRLPLDLRPGDRVRSSRRVRTRPPSRRSGSTVSHRCARSTGERPSADRRGRRAHLPVRSPPS